MGSELYRRELWLARAPARHGGLEVPGEGILCRSRRPSPSPPRRCWGDASWPAGRGSCGVNVATGAGGPRLQAADHEGRLDARLILSTPPGCGGDEVDRCWAAASSRSPRRGELIVYDKLACGLIATCYFRSLPRRRRGYWSPPPPTATCCSGRPPTTSPARPTKRDDGRGLASLLAQGEADPARARVRRGDGDLRRPSRRDRGPRLSAPLPPRAALRLRRRHPLDRRHRLDGDREHVREGLADAGLELEPGPRGESTCGCPTSATSSGGPTSVAS